MGIILLWLIGALIIGAIGNEKTIGFWGAFLLSLLLSPLFGLIIVLFYPSKQSQKRLLEQQQMQTQILQSMATSQSSYQSTHQYSTADEIQKLKALYDANALTEEEYETQKKKLLGQGK